MQLATNCKARSILSDRARKLFTIMRLTGILLLAASLQVSASGFSQGVTISVKDVPVKKIFKEIIRQSGMSMIYKETDVKKIGKISIDVKNASVEEVLSLCLKNLPFKFKVLNNTVVVEQAPVPVPNTVRDQLEAIPPPEKKISGKVTDEKGEPLAGVTVQVKGSNTYTVSALDGTFSINAPENAKVLVFSYVGRVTQEVSILNQTSLQIQLLPTAKVNDDIVVIGYGTTKKVTTSGAIASISSKEIKTISASNAAVALQGRIPGLQIYRAGGPLAGARYFQLRGVASLGVNSSPLILIDGVPGDINSVNPEQIEDISVLKDATTSAVYGASAAGGIVLITTKNGKEGKVKVDITVRQGVNNFVNLLEPLNAWEQALLVNEARINSNLAPAWSPKQIDSLGNGGGTNWIKNVTRTGMVKEANLQISGGGNKTNFILASNYVKEEGSVVGNWAERANTRLKLNSNLTNWLKLGVNLFAQFQRGRGGADLVSAGEYSSFIPKYLPDGRPGIINPSLAGGAGGGQAGGLNPLQGLEDSIRGFSNYNPSYNLNSILTAEVKITSFLKFNTIFNYGIGFNYAKNYFQDFVVYDAIGQSGGGAVVARRQAANRAASASFGYGTNWSTQNYFTFNKKLGTAHDITAVAGFRSAKTGLGAGISASRSNFANNIVQNVNAGGAAGQSGAGSDNTPSTSYSYFGRIAYTYNTKYTVEGSVSRDGSDRFGPKNKYGNFGGVGASWRISQEKFFEKLTRNKIDEMKIRASYGAVGNDRIPQFLYYSAVNINGSAYPFGPYNSAASGGANQDGSILPNPAVKWETLTSLNFGTDITFLKNWNLSLDWYKRVTKDLLFQVPVSPTTGFDSQFQNIGNLTNKGIEVSLNYNNSFGKNITFNSRLIFTKNTNVITELFNGVSKYAFPTDTRSNAYIVGQSVGNIYGWKVLGIFQTAAQVAATPHFGSPEPGDFIYEDTNKDGKIDTDDYQTIGNSLPKGEFAWTNSVTWKNIDFNLHMSAAFGGQIAQSGETRFQFAEGISRNNLHYLVDRWRGPGTSTTTPRVAAGNNYNVSGARAVTSATVQDGDYLRIRQIELGYTLPSNLLKRSGLTSARAFVNTTNPFTFTKFYGWDPESGSSGQRYGFYPIYRTITFGINVGL